MNTIKKIIQEREIHCFKFVPNHAFYAEVGIKQKRWGAIFRGDISMTIDEARRISKYFNIPFVQLFE